MASSTMDYEDWIKQKNEIADILTTLRASYLNLAIKYRALPLQLRRDVSLPHAQERFNCAALLQHYPAPSQTSGNGTANVGKGETDQSLPANEDCPVSRGWYADLDKAGVEMVFLGVSIYKGADLATVKEHVRRAASSLYHTEMLFKTINGQLPLLESSRSHAHIIKAWNRLCEELRAGGDFGTALLNATHLPVGPPTEMYQLRGGIHSRAWFMREQSLPAQSAPAHWLAQLQDSSVPPPKIPWLFGAQHDESGPKPPSAGFDLPPRSRGTGTSPNVGGKPAAQSPTEPSAASFGSNSASGSAQTGSWGNFTGFNVSNSPWTYGGDRGAFRGGYGDQSHYGNRADQGGYGPRSDYGKHSSGPFFDGGPYRPSFDPNLYGQGSSSYYPPPPSGNPFTFTGGNTHTPRGYAPPAPTATPAPTPTPPVPDRFAAQKERLQKYNSRWEALTPSASHRTIPFPSRILNMVASAERNVHGLGQRAISNWSAEDHIKVNVSKFWAEGCGVEVRVSGSKKTVEIRPTNTTESLKVLRKQLRMKEASRWHPDTLNRRTGNENGGTDESIGKMKEMKAIWGALQDFLAQVETML